MQMTKMSEKCHGSVYTVVCTMCMAPIQRPFVCQLQYIYYHKPEQRKAHISGC